ncbi:hypothetical protein Barb7_03139 [Bacteroidales bacterium Barb7]|nr:hypothetical protein Barb7_03139 [Bacteroidales bacterium Barb7]
MLKCRKCSKVYISSGNKRSIFKAVQIQVLKRKQPYIPRLLLLGTESAIYRNMYRHPPILMPHINKLCVTKERARQIKAEVAGLMVFFISNANKTIPDFTVNG